MSETTMNFAQLVQYLHLPESQVKKLVDKGEIPGRRVNNELVFITEQVNRWLETRIGISGEKELADIDRKLEPTPISIEELLKNGRIALPLPARTKDSAIRSMVALAVETGNLWDGDAMTEAIKAREDLHSTAMDNGVALLHSRRPMPSILGDNLLLLGLTPSGIPFGGGFNNLTDVFFLICSMDDRIHLQILTRLSRILTTPGFLDKLREQSDEAGILDLIAETEAPL